MFDDKACHGHKCVDASAILPQARVVTEGDPQAAIYFVRKGEELNSCPAELVNAQVS